MLYGPLDMAMTIHNWREIANTYGGKDAGQVWMQVVIFVKLKQYASAVEGALPKEPGFSVWHLCRSHQTLSLEPRCYAHNTEFPSQIKHHHIRSVDKHEARAFDCNTFSRSSSGACALSEVETR